MPKKNNQAKDFDFKDFLVGFIESFLKKIGAEIIDDVKEKSKEIMEQIRKKATGTFFSALGFIFFLVGFSLVLEVFLPVRGIGFLISGIIVMFTGILITIKK